MDSNEFIRIQAESFIDYARKNSERDFVSLFQEWADSKDIFDLDREMIWRSVRNTGPRKERVIRESDEEFVRLSAVLDMLLEHDFSQAMQIIEKSKEEVK